MSMRELDQADGFLNRLYQQFEQPEGHGFYFPSSFKASDLNQFVRGAADLIHRDFFDKSKVLSRRQREDFIEIFDQLLVLKLIDHYGPTTVSFTCKDALDTGAAASAIFFGFVQLLQGSFGEKKEVDYFRWLLYAPALFVRERAIDPERLCRVLTGLERFDAGMKENSKSIMRDFEKLFSAGLLTGLGILP